MLLAGILTVTGIAEALASDDSASVPQPQRQQVKLPQMLVTPSLKNRAPQNKPPNTDRSDGSSYLQDIEDKIQENSRPMLAFHKDTKVVVAFKIRESGEVTELKVIKSSNNQRFDGTACHIIEKASPFPKPPADLVRDAAEIEFAFDGKFKANVERFLRMRSQTKSILRSHAKPNREEHATTKNRSVDEPKERPVE